LAEFKNAKVVHDLILLYNKIAFELLTVKIYPFFLKDDEGERDYTRGVLKVIGNLHGELLNILVNHWASRRKDTAESAPKRIAAAETLRSIVDGIQKN
jgi:hypothetical protein